MSIMSDPAQGAVVVTPSDSTTIPQTRGLYIGGSAAGDLAVTMQSGSNCTFPDVQIGTVLPVRVTKVLSTGTAGTLEVVALY